MVWSDIGGFGWRTGEPGAGWVCGVFFWSGGWSAVLRGSINGEDGVYHSGSLRLRLVGVGRRVEHVDGGRRC